MQIVLPVVILLLLGGVVLAGAFQWPANVGIPRDSGLGLLVGAFGAIAFWTGVLVGRRAEQGRGAPRTPEVGAGPSEQGGTPGTSASQEEAKEWLRKFLAEQQKRTEGEKRE